MKNNYYSFAKVLIVLMISFVSLYGFAQEPLQVGIASSSQTICSGAMPFQLTATGPLNGTSPSYQWQSSADNLVFDDISGATVITYQPPTLTATAYYRQMQNAEGTTGGPLPTNVVTVTVKPIFAVGSISPSQIICSGALPAPLAGVPPSTGSAPTYQWQASPTLEVFFNVNGATNLSFQPNPLYTFSDTLTWYFRQIQNDPGTCGGPEFTNIVSILLKPYLTAGSVSGNQTICTGDVPALLTGVTPPNGSDPIYQWQSSLDNVTFSNVNGATMLDYQPGALTTNTWFRMQQDDFLACGGPVYTNSVKITMNPLNPVSVSIVESANPICTGTPVTFTATPVNEGLAPVYQWKVNGVDAGPNNPVFTYNPAINDVVTCVLTSNIACPSGNPATSNAITILSEPPLMVGSISANQSICPGAVASQLDGVPPGNGTSPAYQWQSSLDNVTFANISGATQLNYQPEALTATTHYRQLQNALGTCGGPLPTNVVTVTVNPLPTATISGSTSVCQGFGAVITIAFTGTSPWNFTLYDGVMYYPMVGVTQNPYITNVFPPNGSLTYTITEVSDATTCSNTGTGQAVITVIPRPTATISGSTSICAGSSTSLSVDLTGVPPWSIDISDETDIIPISGITTSPYIFDVSPSSTTTYSIPVVRDATICANIGTGSAIVTVNPLPGAVAGADRTICAGSSTQIGAAPVSGSTYSWVSVPAGFVSTEANPTVSPMISTLYSVTETVTATNCSNSHSVVVSVDPILLVGSISASQTICNGATPSPLIGVAPGNGTSPTYQWQSSLDNVTFANISGATQINYAPDALTATTHYRQMQNAMGTCGGPLPTNTATITVNPIAPVSIAIVASVNPICAGVSVTFTATPVNEGTAPVYQWKVNGANAGTDNPVFTYNPAINDLITCVLTSNIACPSGNPATSNVITVLSEPLLIVGSISANQSVCTGTSPAELNGVPPGNGTSPTYQWQSSLDNVTFANISGATQINYQPEALTATTHYRQIQNALGTCGGPLPTNTVTITVNQIVAVGVSITASSNPVCVGVPVTFTAVPENGGSLPVYQWKVNGANAGANNPVFTYTPVANDAVYCTLISDAPCVIGNPAVSNTINMVVDPTLLTGSISGNQSICQGSVPLQLNGVAPGNGTSPTYQWQSSLDNVTFANINGATALNYQSGALTATTYFRQMQNASGTCGGPLPTNVVTILVNPSIIPGTASADQTICNGETPLLISAVPPVNGTLPTYQWQSSLNNTTFSNINGATMLNYQPNALTNTTYYRQMQNATGVCGGPLPTNVVTITVNPSVPVAVSINPSGNPVCTGTAVTFTASPVNGGTAPQYQWKVNGTNQGTNNPVFSYNPVDGDVVICVMTSDVPCAIGNPATSNTVTMTVQPNLLVGAIAADQSVCSNAIPALLTATPPSNGTSPTYQWQSSLDNNTFNNIAGATALNYQSGLLSTTTYFRQMQNASGVCGGPLATNVVTITITEGLAVGAISADQSICEGAIPALLTATPPSNGTAPTYQWQSSLNNLTFANIGGATQLNYQSGVLSNTTYFRLLQNASGVCGGPLPTNVVTITVTPGLVVGSVSASQTICNGSIPALFTGVAPSNGTSPTYQWQSSLDNVTFANINGATALNYQSGALTATTYFRQMQNASGTCGGPLPTNVVTVTVGAFPGLAVGSISANQALCTGNIPALLTGVPPSNGTLPSYQWQSSLDNTTFANINGATALNYQPGALTANTYYRQMQDAQGTCGGPLPTNTVTILVNPPLAVGSISANQAICSGTTPALLIGIAPSNGTSPTYQWQSSLNNVSFANINGATALNYQPGSLTATTYYRQLQNASGTCGGPLSTNVVTITINPNLVVGSIGSNQAICSGTVPAQLNGVAPSNGTLPTYQWQSSLNNLSFANITGATSLNYQPGALTATTYYRQQQNASGTCGGPLFTNVVTITVNPLPIPTIAGAASVCLNSTGNVYTTQPGMTGYDWTLTGGTITAGAGTNAITVTWNTLGVHPVTVNYTNANNCTAPTPGTYNVTVNPLPVPTIAGPASVCLNSTGNVYTTQTGMTGYTWTITGGVITAGASTNAITVTWNTVGAQTLTVNYANANNCTAATPATYAVTVNPLPVPTIAGPASVCLNATGVVYTTETGMTGYTWTVTGGTITAGAGTSAITVTWNTAGTQTLTVNYVNANSCTAATPATYTVTVNPLPVPTITGPASACLNSTGNVYTTQSGMTSYVWSVTGGVITAGAGTNAITVTWNLTGAKTVCVNYNNANGCTAATPSCYNVTVNPLPVPTITGLASVCLNSTGIVYTTEAGMTGYAWTITGGTITAGATTNSITVTWTSVGVQTLTVNYINGTGCTAATPTSKTINVNPLPVPTITGPASICVGTTSNVYTTEAGMTGYTWTVSAGGTITAGSTSNSITVTWTTPGAKTVCVNYTNANGCTATAPTCYNVTVNAIPVPTITGPASVCQGASATYTTQAGMTNYAWTVSAGGTITSGGTPTSNTVTVTWNVVGGQAVTVAYTNVCPATAPGTYNVTVNAAPVPTIGSTNNPCVGSTNNIYYTESGMTGYIWTVSSGGTIVSGQGTSTLNVTWGSVGIQTVSVNYMNAAGCYAAQPTIYTVFVNSPPNAAGPITGTATVCAGTNNIVFSTTPVVGATSYSWTVPAGATIASGVGTTSITVNFGASAVSGSVTVAGTNQCGNGPASTFAVTVNPLPAAAGTITGPASVCAGSQGVVYTVPAIANATSYTWTTPAGATIVSGGNTNSIVVNFGTNPGSGIFTVKGSNTCGIGAVSPNFTVTINAIPAAPVVTANGAVLTSSVATGNQWYYEGTGLIPGATGQTYTATITGWYWSVVTVNGCSSDTSNHVYVLFVGQQELPGTSFNVYPVPNNGKFNVAISTPTEETFTIRVYNQLGAMVYEMNDARTSGGKFNSQIALQNVSDGLYSVVFLNEQHKVIRKMVVSRLILD